MGGGKGIFVLEPRILHPNFALNPYESKFWNLSYSNQGEDLILRSLFKQRLRSGSAGFYVDIGSWDPRMGNNTYLLYLYGWEGICIEPNPAFADAYSEFRPRDAFINTAVGEAGKGYWAEAGEHSAASKVAASKDDFGPGFGTPREITFMPLKTVFDGCVPSDTKIDLMCIDVEGSELAVLRSNDWSRYRPEIIVIEDNAMDAENLFASPTLAYLRDLDYRVVAAYYPNVILKAKEAAPATSR